MSLSPIIRTLTFGIAEPHPLSVSGIQRASELLKRASRRFTDAGYEVQTLRLSTRPLLDDLADWSPAALISYAQDLQRILDDASIAYCSLGTAQAARPDFPLAKLDLLADLLIPTRALNVTVQIATLEHGLRPEAALPTARIIQRLARETEEGFGNFNFAMLACMPPGSPFFPAAYHAGSASLTIGLQGASLVAAALRGQQTEPSHMLDLARVTQGVQAALLEQATPIVQLGQEVAEEHNVHFGGIDLSPAPMGEDSIGKALEMAGYGPVGSPGTVAVAAAITSALKQTPLPTCGYCGLMLPVLEDVVLGQRWEEGRINAHQLLLYSSVCGTGLDTIPLPGESSAESIAALLLDVATLATRLRKPLSARLFPVPGKQVGEYTAFTSQYLTNTRI